MRGGGAPSANYLYFSTNGERVCAAAGALGILWPRLLSGEPEGEGGAPLLLLEEWEGGAPVAMVATLQESCPLRARLPRRQKEPQPQSDLGEAQAGGG